MGIPVVAGATCTCTMGTAPGQIKPTCQASVRMGGKPVATIADAAPLSNVSACGMCTSLMNPAVASATAAALGTLTPQPCVPAPMGVWVCPGSVRVGGKPVLTSEGTLSCSYGGTISVMNPGQSTVKI